MNEWDTCICFLDVGFQKVAGNEAKSEPCPIRFRDESKKKHTFDSSFDAGAFRRRERESDTGGHQLATATHSPPRPRVRRSSFLDRTAPCFSRDDTSSTRQRRLE
jgi:hypothetical protein